MIPLLRTAVKFGDRQQINSQWGQSPLRLSWQWSELQRNAHQKYFVTLALHLCNEETGYFLKAAKLGLSSKQRICYVVFNLRYVTYGADTWTVIGINPQRPQSFRMQCQRRRLGVKKYHFILNATVSEQTELLSINAVIRDCRPVFVRRLPRPCLRRC